MKLTKNNLANGLALATAILWILCSAFVAIFPDFSHTVTVWWMHGMDIAKYSLSWSNFILGGLSLVAAFWLVGYVVGWSLECVDKKNGAKR